MFYIIELLKLRGLDTSKKIKIIRHQSKNWDLADLANKPGMIEIYQSYQAKPVLECDYIVSFIGFDASFARFYGVFEVKSKKQAQTVPLPKEFPYQDMDVSGLYYDLIEVPGFEGLKHRVVIKWGKAALAWHQWLNKENNKEIIQILPEGYVREFPGYLDTILTYDQLVGICQNPIAHKVWHDMLSAVAGIYLIVDTTDGMQYVGSAYGEAGILGRWMSYVGNGHGGNKKLIEILSKDPERIKHFQYTILQTLNKTLPQKEVQQVEQLYMKKLGSRAFGLNS